MKIKNFEELGTTPLRRAVLEILEAGYQAIDTEKAIRDKLEISGDMLKVGDKEYDLGKYERIFLLGVGKCAFRSGRIISELLAGRISDGVVIDVETGDIPGVRVYRATHPRPSKENVMAANEMFKLVQSATERDLILAIISGGGSTMMCLPFDISDKSDISDVSWQAEADLFTELSKAGADIEELNTVRKHTSALRGGNLTALANGARIISLVFSDVPGHEADFIASGPIMFDQTTVRDANRILAKYAVETELEIRETPKDPAIFANTENVLVVSNNIAVQAMRAKAEQLGFRARIETVSGRGEAEAVGQGILRALREAEPNSLLIWGGETTVTVRGNGTGGRNQQVALAILPDIRPGELILAAASDGRDNTDAAGAICDILTKSHAEAMELSPADSLASNDSFIFFRASGDQIITGPTGSNVADFILALNGTENYEK